MTFGKKNQSDHQTCIYFFVETQFFGTQILIVWITFESEGKIRQTTYPSNLVIVVIDFSIYDKFKMITSLNVNTKENINPKIA